MVDMDDNTVNQLFETLRNWDEVLQYSSFVADALDGEGLAGPEPEPEPEKRPSRRRDIPPSFDLT